LHLWTAEQLGIAILVHSPLFLRINYFEFLALDSEELIVVRP
jgi:hypothetical protein